MMFNRIFAAGLAVVLFCAAATAQKAEVTVSLNEAFFDALLDSVFQNFDPLEFSLADNRSNPGDGERPKPLDGRRAISSGTLPTGRVSAFSGSQRPESLQCRESIRILKEMSGVRTAVRFRDGRIYVPLAFSGGYAPPFVGCVEFAGWAETNIDLEFDREGQRLVGRVRVLNVNLNGARGIGGTVIARLIQSSIDKKLNPIEIVRLDKLSFAVPVRNGAIRMKAISARPELVGSSLNIYVSYEFHKG